MIDQESDKKLTHYLDSAIRKWRIKLTDALCNKQKDTLFPAIKSTDEIIAECYIDAFQSVRISMTGSLLPKEND